MLTFSWRVALLLVLAATRSSFADDRPSVVGTLGSSLIRSGISGDR